MGFALKLTRGVRPPSIIFYGVRLEGMVSNAQMLQLTDAPLGKLHAAQVFLIQLVAMRPSTPGSMSRKIQLTPGSFYSLPQHWTGALAHEDDVGM